MLSDEYIFPSELVALPVFLFAPPLALALSAQAWVFAARLASRSAAPPS